MQTWKSPHWFVFMQKQYPENVAFLILEILETFVYQVWKCFKK